MLFYRLVAPFALFPFLAIGILYDRLPPVQLNYLKQNRNGCNYPHSEGFYTWFALSRGNAFSCDMDGAQQSSVGDRLDACPDWLRAFSLYPMQFQTLPHNSDSDKTVISQYAQSRCYMKADLLGTYYSERNTAPMASARFVPSGCTKLQTSFWYRMSSQPIITRNRSRNYFLELILSKQYPANLIGESLQTFQIWGSTIDFQGFPGANVWTNAAVEYSVDTATGVFLNFFAHHGDTCNTMSIDLDTVETRLAVPKRNCNATTTTSGPLVSELTKTTTRMPLSRSPNPVSLSTFTTSDTQLPVALSTIRAATAVPAQIETTTTMILSPISVQLQQVINKENYPNTTAYYTQSAHNVLETLENGIKNESLETGFGDIMTIAQFFQEFAEMPPPLGLLVPEGAQENAVNTLLQITDATASAEESGTVTADDSQHGQYAAATIYQSLEKMYNNLPLAKEPYIFTSTYSLAYAHVFHINVTSIFDQPKMYTKLIVSSFSWERGITSSTNESMASVAVINLNVKALREAYEELKNGANTTRSVFAFSLSAMPEFRFARYTGTNEAQVRSSPIMLLASVDHTLSRRDIITIRHNVDRLFHNPSGVKRRHQCIFLDYTLQQWSEDGCRLTAKYPQWGNTTVECTCDHLTPFSLLLTLCGSLSNSFASRKEPFTFDLAVVTTATTTVSAVCCLVSFVIIIVKVSRKTVVFDEVTFTRTGLWIVLFGMYFFILLSQLMVYTPEICEQRFCLVNAILLHWFALMSIAWTTVQTVRVIQIIRFPQTYGRTKYLPGDTYHRFRMKTWFAATVIPGVFPFLASVSHFSESSREFLGGYGYASQEKWCWLDGDHLWIPWVTFIAPMSIAALLNVAAVVIYIKTTKGRRKKLAALDKQAGIQADTVKSRLYGVIITTGLMGFTWLSVWLALFSCLIDETLQYVCVILLTVACGSQAVYIIIFQAVIPEKQLRKGEISDKNY
ncbi:uncharacterized protein LOC129581726 [Paramacrobiotus metropolitanus]|uniref:uncharacterized protein LOC129581726 n=1 Tax=Paramacrobiotus metropolitanus TaxID=2943436 RepID=UPI0024463FC1|nr:uncharacterized protein LOC129581726 [Paramacrobiotus metropolitanus]